MDLRNGHAIAGELDRGTSARLLHLPQTLKSLMQKRESPSEEASWTQKAEPLKRPRGRPARLRPAPSSIWIRSNSSISCPGSQSVPPSPHTLWGFFRAFSQAVSNRHTLLLLVATSTSLFGDHPIRIPTSGALVGLHNPASFPMRGAFHSPPPLRPPGFFSRGLSGGSEGNPKKEMDGWTVLKNSLS